MLGCHWLLAARGPWFTLLQTEMLVEEDGVTDGLGQRNIPTVCQSISFGPQGPELLGYRVWGAWITLNSQASQIPGRGDAARREGLPRNE